MSRHALFADIAVFNTETNTKNRKGQPKTECPPPRRKKKTKKNRISNSKHRPHRRRVNEPAPADSVNFHSQTICVFASLITCDR